MSGDTLMTWAQQWQVPYAAVQDLRARFGMIDKNAPSSLALSESAAQSQVRLEASRLGGRLWRNNVGAATHGDGSFVRYGLANESKQLNDLLKSSDLVGIKPVLIDYKHVGHTIGQFLCREIKVPGWTYSNTEREQAQYRWIQLVSSLGGDAAFATGEGTIL